jgi:hypothetical protein
MNDNLLGTHGWIGKRRYWNGEGIETFKGHHLGVGDGDNAIPRSKGSVDIGAPDTVEASGWGFGHHRGIDDKQGFGWAGKEVGKTVFEISVKTTPLTEAEKKYLRD